MNPFESYARAVGDLLPWRKRKDVVREVLSDLYAEFDDVRAKSSVTDDDLLMQHIVREREIPGELASSFDERVSTLIGPDIYPYYRFSLWIALATSIITIVAIAFGLRDFSSAIGWTLAGNIGLAVVIVFSAVTITFAIIERLGTSRSSRVLLSPHAYAPQGRPPLSQIAFAALLLLLLNVFPSYAGLPLVVTEPSFHLRIFPILARGFLGAPRAFINIWCIAAITMGALDSFGLKSHYAGWLHLGLRFLGVAVGIGVLVNGNVFAIPSDLELSMLPQNLTDAMTHVVAPNLFKALLVMFWLGLGIRIVYLVMDVMRRRGASGL